MRPVRVLHVITGLEPGGAERFLQRLVLAADPQRVRSRVVSLKAAGSIGRALLGAGVPVHAVDAGALPVLAARLFGLRRAVRAWAPDVVQGWLHHGDLAATFLAGDKPLAWNLRMSSFDQAHRASTRAVARACGLLSDRPQAIVACSEAARRAHLDLGYAPDRVRLIENGSDPALFFPDLDDGLAMRRELGLPDDALVIGCLARADPMKDHATLLRAFAGLRDRAPWLLLAGEGSDGLLDDVAPADRGRVRALGSRPDPERVLRAVDVLALSSRAGEGLPNAVVEAALSGVPAVVTDVGDAPRAAGPSGAVAPPGDADALGAALGELLDAGPDERARRGAAARTWARAEFSISRSVEAYQTLWEELAEQRGRIGAS